MRSRSTITAAPSRTTAATAGTCSTSFSTEDRRLTAFATDDAHFKTPDHFGGWVHVKSESLDPEALLEALKTGHYYSSQGPQIHELSISGKELTIACSPVDTIVVLCGNSRTVGAQWPRHHRRDARSRQARQGLAADEAEPVVPRSSSSITPAGAPGPIRSGGMSSDPQPLWPVVAALGVTQIIGWGTTFYALGALSPDIAS